MALDRGYLGALTGLEAGGTVWPLQTIAATGATRGGT
jgi:hypothetical protein